MYQYLQRMRDGRGVFFVALLSIFAVLALLGSLLSLPPSTASAQDLGGEASQDSDGLDSNEGLDDAEEGFQDDSLNNDQEFDLLEAFSEIPSAINAFAQLNILVQAVDEESLAGNTITFRVQYSCSALEGSCDDVKIVADIPAFEYPSDMVAGAPEQQPGIVQNTGGGTVIGDSIVWELGSVAAGSTNSVTFTLNSVNDKTPDGTTVTPEVTIESGTNGQELIADPVSATVRATSDLKVVKASVSSLPPVAGEVYRYRIVAGPSSMVTGQGWLYPWLYSTVGVYAITNLVVTDTLPEGAEFVSATGGGELQPDGRTVIWPAVSGGGTTRGAGAEYFIEVKYPADIFIDGEEVVNTASATAHDYLFPHKTLSGQDEEARNVSLEIKAIGSASKGPTLPTAPFGSRGHDANFNISYRNGGNVPLRWEVTDNMPCAFTSPDIDNGCDIPALKDLRFRNRTGSGSPAETIKITYHTNFGSTGEHEVHAGVFSSPVLDAGEWITNISIDTEIMPGSNGIIEVTGTINEELPDTSFLDVNDYVGDVHGDADLTRLQEKSDSNIAVIENCLTVNRISRGSTVIQDNNPCGYVKVNQGSRKIWGRKFIDDGIQNIGGEMTVRMTLQPWLSALPWTPIVVDPLGENLEYVEDSFEVVNPGFAEDDSAALTKDRATFEVENDADGNEVVRITWSEEAQLRPNSTATVSFKVKIKEGTPIGTYSNTANFFELTDDIGGYGATTFCDAHGKTSTEYDDGTLSGVEGKTSLYCPWSANYTVLPTGSANIEKQVKGSLDEEYGVHGLTEAGETSVYKIIVENDGNIPLDNILVYDMLPAIGDTTIGGNQQRDSDWPVTLTAPVSAPGAVVEYTHSANPCRPEVLGDGRQTGELPAGCTNDWSQDPGDLDDVKGLRINFGGSVWESKEVREIIVEVKAPDAAEGVAWNSVAVTGREADNKTALLPNEPNKVGLSVSPSISLDSSAVAKCYVDDDTDELMNEIAYNLNVTNGSSKATNLTFDLDVVGDGFVIDSSQLPAGVTLDDGVITIAELAKGNSILIPLVFHVAIEDAEFFDVTSTLSSVTEMGVLNPDTAPSTNTRIALEDCVAPVYVTKAIEGSASDQVPEGQTFEIQATFANDVVKTYNIVAGVPFLIGEFPVGTEITFTEVQPENSDAITWGVPTISPENLTVGLEPRVDVTVTNFAETTFGTFTVSKVLNGPEKDNETAPSEFEVVATWNEDNETKSHTMIVPVGETVDFATSYGQALPAGTVVTLSEVLPADGNGLAWSTPTFIPGNEVTVGLAPVEVKLENFVDTNTGTIQVLKAVTGEAADRIGSDVEFQVRAEWTLPGSTDTQSVLLTVKNDGVEVPLGVELPVGTKVRFTEINLPEIDGLEWNTPQWSVHQNEGSWLTVDASGVATGVVSDDPVEGRIIKLTNSVDWAYGDLEITKKIIEGDEIFAVGDSSLDDDASFDVRITHITPALPAGADFPTVGEIITLNKGNDWTWKSASVLPKGTVVKFEEVNLENGAGYEWAKPYYVIGSGPDGEYLYGDEITISGEAKTDNVEIHNRLIETTEVDVDKTVTGPKGDEVENHESSTFQVTATWVDADEQNRSCVLNVFPNGHAVPTVQCDAAVVDGKIYFPINTEITFTESGAHTDVTNVKWGEVIWTASGDAEVTKDGERSAKVVLTGGDKVVLGLENKTSSNGLIIIPIPIPIPPLNGGSSFDPPTTDPVDPNQPGKPSEPSTPGKPGEPVSPEKTEQHTNVTPGKKGLASTGANVLGLVGGAAALIIGGAWLTLRGRKNRS